MSDPGSMEESRSDQFRMPGRERLALWLLGLVAVMLLGWSLRAMAAVAVPIVFAILATVFIAPFDLAIKRRLPDKVNWLAHVASVLTLFGVLLMFIGAIVFAGQQVLSTVPDLSDQVSSLMSDGDDTSGAGTATDTGGLTGEIRQIWSETGLSLGSWAIERVTAMAETAVTMTGAFTTSIFLILFIVFMALSEIGDWRAKMRENWSSPTQRAIVDSFSTVSKRLRQFLVIRTLVGLLQAALYVGWLAIFGLDLLLVWGTLTFLLTYIPTLGSIIAGTLPVLYALFVLDPLTVLGIAAGLFVIEQIVGNYIDPMLLGQKLVLSPLVILVALLFWGWYWGIAGAFLATPIMLSLLIVFNHVPPLRPLALLLSNQRTADDLDEALET